MKNTKIVITVLTGILMMFVFSCKETTVEDDGNTLTFRVEGEAVGFIEKDSLGNDFNLESFRGKVILLNFSAMWCGPCRREAPELVGIYNQYHARGLEIVQCIIEDEDGNPADMSDLKRWIDEFQLNITVINDPDRSSADLVDISQGIPFNVIIDRDFLIRYRSAGFNEDVVVNAIESLL